MNQKKLSILRVPRRPGAGQALVQSNEDETLQAEQAALKARASLKEEYDARYQQVNIYADADAVPVPEATPERKAGVCGVGKSAETSESTQETPQRPGKARVTPDWAKKPARTPWALDNEEPTQITKITQHNVKGITW